MTRQQKEQIRTEFFRLHSDERGFASVAVRRASNGGHYLDVGATQQLKLEADYQGIPVQVHQVSPSVNAVKPSSQTS